MSIDDERIAHQLSLLGGPEEEAAVRSLREVGPGVLPALQSAFARETRPETRSAMLRVVREIDDPSSLTFLVSLVGDAEQDLWGQAVDGLAALGSAEALEALRTLRDEAPRQSLKQQWIEEAICRVKETRQGKGGREAVPQPTNSRLAWDRRMTLTSLAIGLGILAVLVCGWHVHGLRQVSRGLFEERLLKIIVDAAEQVRLQSGKAPQTLEELARVTRSEEFREHFQDQVPLDYWDRPYRYELVEGKPVARTLGKDGVPGGGGSDQDLVWPSPPRPLFAVPLGEYLKSSQFLRTAISAAATGLVMGLLWWATHRQAPQKPPTVRKLIFEGFQLALVVLMAMMAANFIILLAYPRP